MTVGFSPALPMIALGAIAIALLVLCAVSFRRSAAAGALRLGAGAALIAWLAGPVLREEERAPLSDVVLMIVDETASQTLGERAEALRAARASLRDRLGALPDTEFQEIVIESEESSDIATGVRDAVANAPRERLAGVFVLTDGAIADADIARLQPAIPAPVHILLTGQEDERDRKITLLRAPRFGIIDESVEISFRVDDLGFARQPIADRGQARVVLRIDGEEALAQDVPVGVEASFMAPLRRPGQMVIELEASPLEGELTTRNNLAILPITAIRDRLRVLLISGEPHPGERVWRNLLKSDPAVDLVHFTILRPIEKNDGVPISELALIQFPQDELFIEKLDEFDLVIFDRYTYRAVLDSFHFDNVARYVEDGGAVLIAAGPEYAGPRSLARRRNLAYILPALPEGEAVEGAFRPEITEKGARHPVTVDLPENGFWGRWLRLMPAAARRGDILMTGPREQPLLILDRIERGRVGLLLSDHVWLWARGFDGGGPHAELLRRIAHWLMKEPELEEEALSLRDEGGDLILERRSLQSSVEPIELIDPSGATRMVAVEENEVGRFLARERDAAPGLYRARSGDVFAIGAVGLAAPPEYQDVISTFEDLAPLTEATGGGRFLISESGPPALRKLSARASREGASGRAGADWAGVLQRRASVALSVEERALAPPLFWLALIAGLLAAAWFVESGGRRRREAQV